MVFLNTFISYLSNFTMEEWLWMLFSLGIVLYLLYNKKKYTEIFDNAVVMAETSFNHGDNKKKLDAAIRFILARTTRLPFLARLIIAKFISEKRMIDLIEKSLQKFSDIFGSGRKIDIKGNEENGANWTNN